MKKCVWIFLLSSLLILLCSCGQAAPISEAAPTTEPTATSTPTPVPTPTPEPTPSPEELQFLAEQEALGNTLRPLQPKDVFTFGVYEQDGDSEGPEPIEWLVLDRQEDRLFVISYYVLDRVAYHENEEDVTWESSSLRRWLNEEFYPAAFSLAEQSFIPLVTTVTEDNPFVLTDGGNDTEDHLAIPSIDELHNYLSWEPRRQTKYAFNGKQAWYWLRNMGCNLQQPAYISYDGTFNYTPHIVTEAAGVRPVMYLDVG